jgi:small subunit ribosomal protein S9
VTTEIAEAVEAAETPVIPAPSRVQATGKRKSSIARVILEPGAGEVLCNGRPIEQFFGRETLVAIARRPLGVAAAEGRFKITARLHGGGVSGQAGALSHGIAKALIEVDESLRPVLKAEGLLTRDARIKERKKAGLKGARKRPQFSKR